MTLRVELTAMPFTVQGVRQRLRLYRDADVTMVRTHLQGDVASEAPADSV